MTLMRTYDVTSKGITEQLIARDEHEAVQLFRDRWDDAEGPVPEPNEIMILEVD